VGAMTVVETIARVLGTKKVIAFIVLAAALPFVVYALMESMSIEPTPEFEELGWVKFNEPEWVMKQTLALYILLILVIGILLSWKHKLAFATLTFALTLLTGLAEVDLLVEYMNLPVILFLAAMFFIVETARETGVLEELTNRILVTTNFEPALLFIAIIVLSAVLAALISSVVSIVIVVPIVLSLSKALELEPKPFVIASIVATNIGGTLPGRTLP
jgi:di/tricarboxylate transporter